MVAIETLLSRGGSMKVIAINGSPRKDGNTFHAINGVCEQLQAQGIECEILHIGDKPVRGCTACGSCTKNQNEECVLKGDDLNEWIQKIKGADGLILGSPVYFAAVAGTMKCFLDRAFYVAGANGGLFRHKIGVSVVADRRAGGVSTYNQLNNYINYAEMFMPSGNYWNVTYGRAPGDNLQDVEGMQTMRILGKNMAWLMKSIEAGSIPLPEGEKKEYFSHVR